MAAVNLTVFRESTDWDVGAVLPWEWEIGRNDPSQEVPGMTRIVVIGDTHVRAARELPTGILRAMDEADLVVHCGDFVKMAVVDEFQRLSRRFVGVYGNADQDGIMHRLPAEAVFEVEGRRIAVTHPYWGGHPDGLEHEVAALFPEADAVLFGHTHEPCNLTINGALVLNPGQGYASFMVPATYAVLTVTGGELRGEIVTVP